VKQWQALTVWHQSPDTRTTLAGLS